jgi:hypothetical protein
MVAALRGLDQLSEQKLAEMIESAVATLVPDRLVTVELSGGVVLASRALSMPIPGWREMLKNNPSLNKELALMTTVRNVDPLRSSVETLEVFFGVQIGNTASEISLLGGNDYPGLNPELPKSLEYGEPCHWLTSLDTFRMVLFSRDKRRGGNS